MIPLKEWQCRREDCPWPTEPHLHISGAGNCRRQGGYAFLGVEPSDRPSERQRNAMEAGWLLEPVVVNRLREEGWTVRHCLQEQRPCRLDVPGDAPLPLVFVGRPDGELWRDGAGPGGLSIKTLAPWAWSRWRQQGVAVAFPQYVVSEALYQKANGWPWSLFQAVNRATMERWAEPTDYQAQVYDDVVQRWLEVWPALLAGELPAPDYPGDTWHCSPVWCAWSSLCGQRTGPAERADAVARGSLDGRALPEAARLAEVLSLYEDGQELARQGAAMQQEARSYFKEVLRHYEARQIALVGGTVSWVPETTVMEADVFLARRRLSPQVFAEIFKPRKKRGYVRVSVAKEEM